MANPRSGEWEQRLRPAPTGARLARWLELPPRMQGRTEASRLSCVLDVPPRTAEAERSAHVSRRQGADYRPQLLASRLAPLYAARITETGMFGGNPPAAAIFAKEPIEICLHRRGESTPPRSGSSAARSRFRERATTPGAGARLRPVNNRAGARRVSETAENGTTAARVLLHGEADGRGGRADAEEGASYPGARDRGRDEGTTDQAGPKQPRAFRIIGSDEWPSVISLEPPVPGLCSPPRHPQHVYWDKEPLRGLRPVDTSGRSCPQ